ncbi:hypothetical protein DFJ77DRAFT_463046 [Powellomyces hirtus]|nr:hypothetical protein DFJ77DRAFT_463046 [Powellomyces hirtus]
MISRFLSRSFLTPFLTPFFTLLLQNLPPSPPAFLTISSTLPLSLVANQKTPLVKERNTNAHTRSSSPAKTPLPSHFVSLAHFPHGMTTKTLRMLTLTTGKLRTRRPAAGGLHTHVLLHNFLTVVRAVWDAECARGWSDGDSGVDVGWDEEVGGKEQEDEEVEEEDGIKSMVGEWIREIGFFGESSSRVGGTAGGEKGGVVVVEPALAYIPDVESGAGEDVDTEALASVARAQSEDGGVEDANYLAPTTPPLPQDPDTTSSHTQPSALPSPSPNCEVLTLPSPSLPSSPPPSEHPPSQHLTPKHHPPPPASEPAMQECQILIDSLFNLDWAIAL